MLVKLSRMMKEMFEGESVYRWGGEEFVVITTHDTISEWFHQLEAFRESVMKSQLLENETITVSIGVSQNHHLLHRGLDPVADSLVDPVVDPVEDHVVDQRDAFARADHMLLIAKRSGRNRTVLENSQGTPKNMQPELKLERSSSAKKEGIE